MVALSTGYSFYSKKTAPNTRQIPERRISSRSLVVLPCHSREPIHDNATNKLRRTKEELKRKEENEKKQIGDLKRNIEGIAVRLNLSDELKGQLSKVVASKSVDIKGYRFKKDCENKSIIAFEGYRYEDGAGALLRTDAPTYRFLSIHGHPSYLGVLQFGQMYANDTDKEFLRTILTCACKLSSTLATDFYKNIRGADIIFSQLLETEKGIITTLQNS